jgi:hypothetical protein
LGRSPASAQGAANQRDAILERFPTRSTRSK